MKWDGWGGGELVRRPSQQALIKSIDIFKHSTKVTILSLRVSNHKLLDFFSQDLTIFSAKFLGACSTFLVRLFIMSNSIISLILSSIFEK
jgi:hypothetical protein